MSIGRANHGCTSFTDKDDINWTIVSGGVFSFDGDSVINKLTQMLKENSSEWTDMEMNYLYMQIGISPYTNNALSLINFMGKAMLIEGTDTEGTDIYELVKSANGQFEWILSDLSLRYQRTTTFTVLDVPLSSINSSNYWKPE